MYKNILVSTITVVYNSKDLLEKTIQSVVSQTYENIEFIIIDGASNDGTIEIIQKYGEESHWVSEPDKGIYDAMNKGMALAKGDFIHFLNAGDVYGDPFVVEKIVDKIIDPDTVYYGRANVSGEGVSWLYPPREVQDYTRWLKYNLPNHQTMFFPKKIYQSHLFDIRLKIGADDDYKLYALQTCRFSFIDEIVITFQRDGVSSDHKTLSLLKQRIYESFIRNYKHQRWLRLLIDPFKLLLMFGIHNLFGDKAFLKFIKTVVRLKG